MRIALTGSAGMLGSDIKKVFEDDHELIALTRSDFDVTDLQSCLLKITEIKPDYLIHSAAYTDVDGSEEDPERAYLINGIGTRNVVMACQDVQCPIIYISSDYIFDGSKKSPYDEWDRPCPINKYGLSKLLGEQYVMSLTNKFYIVRTSWLYGKNGKNFVDTICRLLTEKEEVEVVADQIGSPTYTFDLAKKIKELIAKGYGTYHVTNSSNCSWYELAVEIARVRSSRTIIKATTSEKYKRPAPRPPYSVLNNTLLKLEGIEELRTWKDALKDFLIGSI